MELLLSIKEQALVLEATHSQEEVHLAEVLVLEDLEGSVLEDLVLISRLKTSSSNLVDNKLGEVDPEGETLSSKRKYLSERILRFKQASPSWRPQRVPAEPFRLLR